MRIPVTLVTVLVTCSMHIEAYTRTNRISATEKRQTTNADQMVQNILQWLQGVYVQNSRRIRQGTLREYLPPAITDKPRPFQPGYPSAGFTPQPPFPFPTNPATGGFTAPESYQPDGTRKETPDQESENHGIDIQEVKSSSSDPSANHHIGETTVSPALPGAGEIPQESLNYLTGQPNLIAGVPTVPTERVTEGGAHMISTATPGVPFNSEFANTTPKLGPTDTSLPPFISAEGVPAHDEVTGYPTQTEPQETLGFPTIEPNSPTKESSSDEARIPADSGPTLAPFQSTTSESVTPRQPTAPYGEQQSNPEGTFTSETALTEGPGITSLVEQAPSEPSLKETTHEESPAEEIASKEPEHEQTASGEFAPREPPAGPTIPSTGSLTPTEPSVIISHIPNEAEKTAEVAPGVAETESLSTTLSPEANTIPGRGEPDAGEVDEELKHPPHVHAIDVQCSKEMMIMTIEFNRVFNGIIYSKGYYSTPECRYVQENSGQTKYTFMVNLEMCGTEFINAFDTQNQSYLENILVLQNEPGIQEVWDTVRSVRCLWEGNLKDTLSVAFSIGMLNQEIVTFSGDTAMAKLDVLLGRGPFGEPANGLVKIGEQMTLVVLVSGDPGFDLHVKDCKAIDSEGKNSIALTDEDGCILKPKLFGAFQKTRETGDTGASIIAYAYFNAFKFPDQMDLMIECNIELCKTDCDMCSKEDQQLEPAKRRRRDVSYNTTTMVGDWATMGKLVRVILPEDLNQTPVVDSAIKDNVCMTMLSFVFSTTAMVTLLVMCCFTSICLWIKRKEKMYLKY